MCAVFTALGAKVTVRATTARNGFHTRARTLSLKKKVLLLTLVLVLASIVGYSIWGSNGTSAMRARLEAIERSGSLPALDDLQGPTIPDDRNALPVLAEIATWLDHEAPIDADPDCLRKAPGAWTDEDRATLATWVQTMEPLSKRLRDALQRPGYGFDAKALFDHQTEAPVAARVLAARAAIVLTTRAVLADDTRLGEALDDLALTLELEDRVRSAGLVFYVLRNESMLRVTQALRTLARRDAFPSQAFRERLEPLLRATHERERLERSLQLERHHVIRMAERLMTDGSVQGWLMRPLRMPDLMTHLDQLGTALDLLPLDESAYRKARAAYLARPPENAQELGADALAIRMPDMLRHLEAELSLTRVALAVLERRAATGALPETLDELAARFEGSIPRDPYTDEAFLFAKTEGVLVLRSAGPGAGVEIPTQDGVETLRWSFPETP
ncbi:MAG: hypothetical protein H6834_08650 [Planctomycetes bacterium]|nr:hypothetical protein [Planctomycetota bacterium]